FNTPMSIPLDDYLGYSNLRIKFNFHGTVDSNVNTFGGSSWAIDNVKIPQAPIPNVTSYWEDLNSHAIISVSNLTNVIVSPSTTTTYAVTSYLNGCTSYGPEGTTYVTVTVNARPTANIGQDQTICYNGTANFSIDLTGTAPWTITYTNNVTGPTTVTTSTNPYLFSVSGLTANRVYTVTNLSDANCNVAIPGGLTGSATVTVLTGTPGVWTGLVSTDWFDCLNWEQGLPSNTINAVINSGLPRMPLIDPANSIYAAAYSNIASAQDIIIASGASVGMATAGVSDLHISRDWKNSGTFVSGTGTVTFNGTATDQIQNINLGIKTNETFYNLTTNTSGGAKGISVVDGFELTVLNNLSLLSGDLRLTGEAQLVQAATTANPIGGAGKLFIDQQGQRNSFNYNYWSSPVSSSADGATYAVGSVLRDGTDITNVIDIANFNQETINFVDGAYSADSPLLNNPIKITSRWIWTYRATIGADPWANYYQWVNVGYWGSIKVGDGYTMKGTGGTAPITAMQNYVFVGKPNSGDISTTQLNPNQTYLIGNPYPSALDANEFIKNNGRDCVGCTGTANVFDGALRFWDHFGLSNNHLLAQYEGGYATYNLSGGTPGASNVPLTANTGDVSSKIPQRYIPVGQGFFVEADDTTTPGNLNFKNGQRVFQRESLGSSIFMKTATSKKSNTQEMQETAADNRPKIRLTFISSLGYHRPLLVTLDKNTSNQFDFGYDAPLNENNKEDMFWQLGQRKLVIQGVNNFNEDQELPLGLKISKAGLASIKIEELENMDENIVLFIKDKFTGKTHNISHKPFEIELAPGTYLDRFSLIFRYQKLVADDLGTDIVIVEPIVEDTNYHVFMNNVLAELQIKNNGTDEIRSIVLYNNLGQTMIVWNKDLNRRIISLPVKLATGVYVVQINTINGTINKRIIIE
ncbi:MAG: T9SS type A sorting domain-containing protein, partial [Lutibacter sp.]